MALTIDQLDALPPDRAAELLTSCCGAPRWVSRMVALRPFGTSAALLAAATRVWRSMERADILAAFAHHPRIGERASDAPQAEQGESWSSNEQAGVDRATSDVRTALAGVNHEYERHFGYIYIVCATGKTAREMLAQATRRLANDPEDELRVAAEEQRKITRLRLEKLLDESNAATVRNPQ